MAHLPGLLLTMGIPTINDVPHALWIELFLINGGISLPAAYCFRKYGFLAPVGVHLWADVVWHVIHGLF